MESQRTRMDLLSHSRRKQCRRERRQSNQKMEECLPLLSSGGVGWTKRVTERLLGQSNSNTISLPEPIVPFLFVLRRSFSTPANYFPSILTNAKLTLLCAHVFTEGMEIFGSNQDRKSSHFFHFFHISYCLCLSDTISSQLLESMQRHPLTIVGSEQSLSWKIWSILGLDRKQRMGEVKIAGPPWGWS